MLIYHLVGNAEAGMVAVGGGVGGSAVDDDWGGGGGWERA